MNLKLTLILIGTIILMMLAGGTASAYIGYLMGREALKVVTQPDINSEQSSDKKKPVGGTHKGLKIVTEREILINVYNYIEAKKKGNSFVEQSLNQQSWNKSTNESLEANETKSSVFPISNRSGDVTLEVSEVQREGNSFTLNVNMKNEGSQPRRFLYSFLDVRDDRGRPLSAITEGLPGQLPANGKNFSGKFRIPLVLIDQIQNISLTLTDYPEQNLKLKLDNIPVER